MNNWLILATIVVVQINSLDKQLGKGMKTIELSTHNMKLRQIIVYVTRANHLTCYTVDIVKQILRTELCVVSSAENTGGV